MLYSKYNVLYSKYNTSDLGDKGVEFGEFFRAQRVASGMTLRGYASTFDEDPAYISRLERGMVSAPKSKEKLGYYAETLGLERESEDYLQFFELASVSNQTYGIHEVQNERLLQMLPVFLRTIDNKNLDEKKLEELVELIRKS